MPPISARLAAFALLAGLALVTTGCFGQDRSVQAVCDVWDEDGLAFHDQYMEVADQASSSDPLTSLIKLAGAPDEMGDLMDKMAAVAPSDIEPAFQQLADSAHQAGGSASDPLTGLASGFMTAISTQDEVAEVNAFLAQNCGIPTQ